MTQGINDDLAIKCIAEVKAHLQTVEKIKGKIVSVYSQEELTDSMKGITAPFVGVVYEGMRAVAEQKETNRQGVSCELVVSLIVVGRVTTAGESSMKNQTLGLLDDLRKAMRNCKSPAGHKWRFNMEAAAAEKQGTTMWIQRWTTPVQLV